jgi:hypothetical protein
LRRITFLLSIFDDLLIRQLLSVRRVIMSTLLHLDASPRNDRSQAIAVGGATAAGAALTGPFGILVGLGGLVGTYFATSAKEDKAKEQLKQCLKDAPSA